MPRNMRRAIAPDQVISVMTAAVEVLCARLPAQRRDTIERTVYDVTAELVSTITDPGAARDHAAPPRDSPPDRGNRRPDPDPLEDGSTRPELTRRR